ncbi:MAG: glycosyltransferase [Bacteroidia bacterium]|nr:glycosyltransferase [Bacteroidia bacterium]
MFSVLFILSGILYFLFILFSWYGWKRNVHYVPYKYTEGIYNTHVSIIIPARNEEKNIAKCLDSIAEQSFSKLLTEIVIVDDHSEDQTGTIVKDWIAKHNIKAQIIFSDGDGMNDKGKKNALNQGIKKATGELIITTDADCSMGKEWLSTIVRYYEKTSADMIVGMVAIKKENNFLSAFQSLELTGLSAIGAAWIYFRMPLLCNGANLAYKKSAFEKTGGFQIERETASGDDTMLMFRFAKQNYNSVHFLKSKEAMVFTEAASSLTEFFSQRKRWGSKVFKQSDLFSVVAALVVFMFHLSLITSLFLALTIHSGWEIFTLLISIKTISEILLLQDVLSFYGKRKLVWYIFPAQIIYPIYIVVTAILSQLRSYEWKGRRVQ